MVNSGKYPVFGANGVIGRYDKFNHEQSELLVTCRGATCGSVNISNPKSWITGNAMVIKPISAEIDRTFLEYFFRGAIDFSKVISGAAQPQITRQSLSPVLIGYPPLPEQKQIVAILDEAFAGIDAAIANTEKNLAHARELFESYLNAVFTQKGDGWVEKKLGEVCVLQRGFDLPKRLRSPGKYPLVSSSGVIDFHTEAKVLAPGVATGRSGSIGNVFFMEEDFWPLNTVLYVKEFFGNDPQFIFHLLKKLDLKQYASGAGVPTLNRNHVHSELVCIPENIDEQRQIVDSLNSLWEETQHLESTYQQKLSALAELKQSILQKAFAGELTT